MAFKKPLVLIVEDEPRQAEDFMNILLDSRRFRPILAKNGEEALELIKKHRRFLGFANNEIKCIVTDIRMPVMTGVEFIRNLRAEERKLAWQRHIPVLFLTAFDDKENWAVAGSVINGFIAGYLTKPLDHPNQLTDALIRIVYKHETEIMIDEIREKSYKRMLRHSD